MYGILLNPLVRTYSNILLFLYVLELNILIHVIHSPFYQDTIIFMTLLLPSLLCHFFD